MLGFTAFTVAQRLASIFQHQLPDNWVPSLPHYHKAITLITEYWLDLSIESRVELSRGLMLVLSFKHEREPTELCLLLVRHLASLYTWTAEQHLTEAWERQGLILAEQCLPQGDRSTIEMKIELADTLLINHQAREAGDLIQQVYNALPAWKRENHLLINRCNWIQVQAVLACDSSGETADARKNNLKETLISLLQIHSGLQDPQRTAPLPQHDVLQAAEMLCIHTDDELFDKVFCLAQNLVEHWLGKNLTTRVRVRQCSGGSCQNWCPPHGQMGIVSRVAQEVLRHHCRHSREREGPRTASHLPLFSS